MAKSKNHRKKKPMKNSPKKRLFKFEVDLKEMLGEMEKLSTNYLGLFKVFNLITGTELLLYLPKDHELLKKCFGEEIVVESQYEKESEEGLKRFNQLLDLLTISRFQFIDILGKNTDVKDMLTKTLEEVKLLKRKSHEFVAEKLEELDTFFLMNSENFANMANLTVDGTTTIQDYMDNLGKEEGYNENHVKYRDILNERLQKQEIEPSLFKEIVEAYSEELKAKEQELFDEIKKQQEVLEQPEAEEVSEEEVDFPVNPKHDEEVIVVNPEMEVKDE